MYKYIYKWIRFRRPAVSVHGINSGRTDSENAWLKEKSQCYTDFFGGSIRFTGDANFRHKKRVEMGTLKNDVTPVIDKLL